MKNLRIKKTIKYFLYTLLVTFLFTCCESGKIPEAPYIVTQTKNCDGCKGKYKYWVKSMNTPTRTTKFITDQVFMIGDTLLFIKYSK
jgi:hypothetical protein